MPRLLTLFPFFANSPTSPPSGDYTHLSIASSAASIPDEDKQAHQVVRKGRLPPSHLLLGQEPPLPTAPSVQTQPANADQGDLSWKAAALPPTASKEAAPSAKPVVATPIAATPVAVATVTRVVAPAVDTPTIPPSAPASSSHHHMPQNFMHRAKASVFAYIVNQPPVIAAPSEHIKPAVMAAPSEHIKRFTSAPRNTTMPAIPRKGGPGGSGSVISPQDPALLDRRRVIEALQRSIAANAKQRASQGLAPYRTHDWTTSAIGINAAMQQPSQGMEAAQHAASKSAAQPRAVHPQPRVRGRSSLSSVASFQTADESMTTAATPIHLPGLNVGQPSLQHAETRRRHNLETSGTAPPTAAAGQPFHIDDTLAARWRSTLRGAVGQIEVAYQRDSALRG